MFVLLILLCNCTRTSGKIILRLDKLIKIGISSPAAVIGWKVAQRRKVSFSPHTEGCPFLEVMLANFWQVFDAEF